MVQIRHQPFGRAAFPSLSVRTTDSPADYLRRLWPGLSTRSDLKARSSALPACRQSAYRTRVSSVTLNVTLTDAGGAP